MYIKAATEGIYEQNAGNCGSNDDALHLLCTRDAHMEQFWMEAVSAVLFERGIGVEGRALFDNMPKS